MEKTQLSDLQQVQIEMLRKFVSICEENHLTYWLGDGSLLGAVRHKGFIPWDDDIDVMMPYEDYKKFTEIAPALLGEEYFLQTTETDKNWYRLYGTIRKNNTSMLQNPRWKINQGVWLDIFIIGNARSKFEWRFQKIMVKVLNCFVMDQYLRCNKKIFFRLITPIGYGLIRLFHFLPWKWRFRLREKIFRSMCRNKGGKFYPEVWCSITSVYDAACFEGEPGKVLFEGVEYKAPHDPDLFLRTQYGDNYMTPIQWQREHEKIVFDLHNSYKNYMNEK